MPTLLAKAQANTNIQLTIDKDFGAETTSQSKSIAPDASETRTFVTYEGLQQADIMAASFTLGDAAAISVAGWTLDALFVPWREAEDY